LYGQPKSAYPALPENSYPLRSVYEAQPLNQKLKKVEMKEGECKKTSTGRTYCKRNGKVKFTK
jgi:hypothetical protein